MQLFHTRFMSGVKLPCHSEILATLRLLLRITPLLALFAGPAVLPQTKPPALAQAGAKGGTAELSSRGPQRRQGSVYIADDDVDIRYGEQRLRADHVEYNDDTSEALARGHVQFDYQNQHLEGDQARYNVATGRGTFLNVQGDIKISRRPNPSLLVSQNPLHFEAQRIEKLGEDSYVIHQAWITVCDPERPKWQFYAPRARIRLGRKVALVHANFRFFRVPLVWVPYATAPAGPQLRQSGILLPALGNSTSKGFVFGDEFYWAPTSWMDTTVGAELLSRRGSAERARLRATPAENISLLYSYFGVIDRRGQGGHEHHLQGQALLPHNWRLVADLNELSSLTFRLAFADNVGDAVNSEVRSSGFLTHNFQGFSFNVAGLSDRNFLSINPEQKVSLRSAPEARFSSVEQAPWPNLPVYFSWDSVVGAVHRQDTGFTAQPGANPYFPINTGDFVARTELAPQVTVPLHLGSWLNLTTSAAFRTTRYGASLDSVGMLTNQPVTRNDGEFALDLRPPALHRYFYADSSKIRYKHTIEPVIRYRYVTGINDFQRFVRFDADATLSNTNEVEYGLTQRLYRKQGDQQPEELLSWRLVQKHYFDPTFGGAIVPGARNVLEPLYSVTPFAFALGPRNSSPIVSDLKVTPAGRYDAEQFLEYDPQLSKISAIGTLLKVKPYREFFATVAHFRLQADPILQPLSHQVRALIGYGSETRKGFNITGGISYDITGSTLQNQLVQVSYNGSCCGLALEYRRIDFGLVRNDNQFRVAFIIANIGTFGNLRRRDRVF
jgi:LPS-assembly protein